MSVSCAHLRRVLERPPAPAPITGPNAGRSMPRRDPYPYRPPAPLPWIVRADPMLKLAISVAVVGIIALTVWIF